MERHRSAGPQAFRRTRPFRAARSSRSSAGVVTSGRRLRRAGLVIALAAALVPASSAAPAKSQRWCKARPSASWRRALGRHVVPLSRTTSLVPWTLAHDGRTFFATVYSTGFSGVARIDASVKRMTRIRAFPDPNDYQADGAFDGRWLVWTEYRGFDNFNDFTVWAWDSSTGTVSQIGSAALPPSGGFWENPWRQPDVRGGIATWAQGSGPDDLTEVHVYDLRTGQDRVVREGRTQGSFLLAGHVVAWPESFVRGAETKMNAASTQTGEAVPVPRALRGLHGVSGLATDGRRIAYPDGPYKSLWWSPSLRALPRKIVAARGANHVDNSVQIGGRYVGFGIQPQVFIGDLKARRYLTVTAHGGWTRLDSKSLLVLYATDSKALDAVARVAFVPLRDLPPIPSCS
jgi:hypothetical protein